LCVFLRTFCRTCFCFFLLLHLIRFSFFFMRLCILLLCLCHWLVCVGPRTFDVIGPWLQLPTDLADRRCRETMVDCSGDKPIMSTDSPGLMDQETGAGTLWDCPEFCWGFGQASMSLVINHATLP
jgi:hypothetical protein